MDTGPSFRSLEGLCCPQTDCLSAYCTAQVTQVGEARDLQQDKCVERPGSKSELLDVRDICLMHIPPASISGGYCPPFSGQGWARNLGIYHLIRDTWESWLMANPGTLIGSKFKSRLIVANLRLLPPCNLGAGPCTTNLEGPSCLRPSEGVCTARAWSNQFKVARNLEVDPGRPGQGIG